MLSYILLEGFRIHEVYIHEEFEALILLDDIICVYLKEELVVSVDIPS